MTWVAGAVGALLVALIAPSLADARRAGAASSAEAALRAVGGVALLVLAGLALASGRWEAALVAATGGAVLASGRLPRLGRAMARWRPLALARARLRP